MESSDDIIFRRATLADLDRIFQVFTDAIREMDRCHIPQWDELYPDKEILKEDIMTKELYLGLLNQEIASAFVINEEYDEQYDHGEWKHPNAVFRVIHRLCVNPTYQNQGIGTKTMRHIESVQINSGIETIRLDAFTLNPFALKLYEKLGYQKVGYATWRTGKFYLNST
jgi:ribosomal protein S18 acetylase RimI-like enzyme